MITFQQFDLFNDLNTNGLNEEEMRLFPLKKAEDWMWKEESSSDSGVDCGCCHCFTLNFKHKIENL